MQQLSILFGIYSQSFLAYHPEAAFAVAQDVGYLVMLEGSSVCLSVDLRVCPVLRVETQQLAYSAHPEFTVFCRLECVDVVAFGLVDGFDMPRFPVQDAEAAGMRAYIHQVVLFVYIDCLYIVGSQSFFFV